MQREKLYRPQRDISLHHTCCADSSTITLRPMFPSVKKNSSWFALLVPTLSSGILSHATGKVHEMTGPQGCKQRWHKSEVNDRRVPD